MDEIVAFLRARNAEDNHAYAYVAQRFGGDALALEYEGMSTGDVRRAGVGFALRVLAQAYHQHPGYREEWRVGW
ncbi:DUF6221 family protein [Streptomyces niveiscabiei]|uniref:DUF6221 family protein n=1 Tax=Streptomyces niveiscabiei TaxID=164115 RepID=UPI0029AA8E13|nr:DUF6221 family protein [Streptomyces niveiscabiei]MDX3385067.1 DUF6221 family protein [Streptomyces niveiscabiei]